MSRRRRRENDEESDDRPPICPACGVTMGLVTSGGELVTVALEPAMWAMRGLALMIKAAGRTRG